MAIEAESIPTRTACGAGRSGGESQRRGRGKGIAGSDVAGPLYRVTGEMGLLPGRSGKQHTLVRHRDRDVIGTQTRAEAGRDLGRGRQAGVCLRAIPGDRRRAALPANLA